jgi:hypothetical protein
MGRLRALPFFIPYTLRATEKVVGVLAVPLLVLIVVKVFETAESPTLPAESVSAPAARLNEVVAYVTVTALITYDPVPAPELGRRNI